MLPVYSTEKRPEITTFVSCMVPNGLYQGTQKYGSMLTPLVTILATRLHHMGFILLAFIFFDEIQSVFRCNQLG